MSIDPWAELRSDRPYFIKDILKDGVRTDTKVVDGVLFAGVLWFCYAIRQEGWSEETQLVGTGDGFRSSLNRKLAKDVAIVALDRVFGEEELFGNLPV